MGFLSTIAHLAQKQRSDHAMDWAKLPDKFAAIEAMRPSIQRAVIEDEIIKNMLGGLPVSPSPIMRAKRDFVDAIAGGRPANRAPSGPMPATPQRRKAPGNQPSIFG